MSEFGMKNPDGSVSVYQKDDTTGYVNPTPIRTESWAVNQGLTPTPKPYDPYGGTGVDERLLSAQLNLAGTEAGAAASRYASDTSRQNALTSADTQMKLAMISDAYVRYRLQMLEIPEMQLQDERERHQMALNAAMFEAEQTGWISANFAQDWEKKIEGSLAPITGFGGTGASSADITDVRRQLGLAGGGTWSGSDTDAVKEWLRLAGNDPGQQPLVQRLQSGQASYSAPAGGGQATGTSPADIANIRQQLAGAKWPGGTDAEAVAAFLGIPATASQTDLVARLRGTAGPLPPNPPAPVGTSAGTGGGYAGIEQGPEFFPDGTRNPMYLPQPTGQFQQPPGTSPTTNP